MSLQTRVPVAALVLAVCSGAMADGVMMPALIDYGRSGSMVESPRQEAVMIHGNGAVRVILRTHFRQGPEDIAWLVPVPATPTDIAVEDEGLFAELDALTAPQFFKSSSSEPSLGLGCGCAHPQNSAWVGETEAITVEALGEAGIFEYVVLAATDADELEQWLRSRGYHIPEGLAAVVKPYIENGWHWLAMRVRPEDLDKATLAPHPIAYSYQADDLVYPLVISGPSSAETNEILLYVASDRQYQVANWANIDSVAMVIDEPIRPYGRTATYVESRPDSPSGTNYEELFRTSTAANEGRLFVTEYVGRTYSQTIRAHAAGDWVVVSRLRAIILPSAMDRDVVLIPSTVTGVFESRFRVRDPSSHQAAYGPWGPIALSAILFGLTGRLRRPARRRRTCAAICGGAAWALLAMI